LNFCNRCGAAVNGALNTRPELVPVDLRSPVRVLGTTICLTTLIGLIVLFIGLTGLASEHIDEGVIAGIGITGLVFLFGVELALIRLVSRLLVAAPEKRKLSLPFMKQSATKEFYAPPQYQPTLPEGRPSVTEHTTRTFTPVYREPRS
jgi:hypothetical protein